MSIIIHKDNTKADIIALGNSIRRIKVVQHLTLDFSYHFRQYSDLICIAILSYIRWYTIKSFTFISRDSVLYQPLDTKHPFGYIITNASLLEHIYVYLPQETTYAVLKQYCKASTKMACEHVNTIRIKIQYGPVYDWVEKSYNGLFLKESDEEESSDDEESTDEQDSDA